MVRTSRNFDAFVLARRRGLGVRVGLGFFLAVAAWCINPGLTPPLWFAAVVAGQMVDLALARRFVGREDCDIGRGEQTAYSLNLLLNGAIYGVLSVYLWWTPGLAPKLFGSLLTAGALLNLALNMDRAPAAAMSNWAPHMLLMLVLPLTYGGWSAEADMAQMSWVTLGGGIYVLHLFIAAKQARTRADQLYDALLSATDANAAKSDFLANVSHEIRTPLNGVLGMTHVMAQDELSETQRSRLEVIRGSGETLLATLNDILDISKIEAGHFDLEAQPFDLAETVQIACRSFVAMAQAKGVGFSVDVAPEAAGPWVGDSARLGQIVGNLASNAVKFTASGRIALQAHASGDTIVLKVEDTGIGIPAETIPKLFEKFAQADSSTTRRFGGTGLGLAICRQIAALMGGELTVRSEEGRGSCFELRLPLRRATAEPADEKVEEVAVSLEGLRVLAAEDNATNQLVLRSLLEPFGVVLHLTGDGVEAVEAFAEREFDVVLLDIQMPNMSGLEAAERIRRDEKRRGVRRTPLLAFSANAMTHQVSAYLEHGFDGHVAKPVVPARLLQALMDAARPRAVPELAARAG